MREGNNIWSYWEGPKPPYIDLCFDTLRKHCTSDFNVNILTADELAEHLPSIRGDLDNLRYSDKSNKLIVKVDYIRAKLLQKYGGIWVDADAIVMNSLKPVRDMLVDYDFVGFCTKGVRFAVSIGVMASRSNGIIMTKHVNKLDSKIDKQKIFVWAELGHKSLTSVVQAHRDICYLFSNREFNPISFPDWKVLFSLTSEDNFIDDNTYVVCLFNKVFPSSFRSLSKDEILSKDWLISKLFRKSLGL